MNNKRRIKKLDIDAAVKSIVTEMQMSTYELVGRLLANVQYIETQMKVYLQQFQGLNIKKLEGRTFGQLLKTIDKDKMNSETYELLESVRDLRNETAHNFFIFVSWGVKKFGQDFARLEHKSVRKNMRITEWAMSELDTLLKNKEKTKK